MPVLFNTLPYIGLSVVVDLGNSRLDREHDSLREGEMISVRGGGNGNTFERNEWSKLGGPT